MDKQALIDGLNEDLAGELSAVIQEAEAFLDKGLVVQLEDMVHDESGHSEETERILRDWPL
jgi:hypothetical protein